MDGPVLALCDAAQLGGLSVCLEQRRETLGIAARHAIRGCAVGPNMVPGDGDASSVAGHVVVGNEA